jgi:hypothetical protein
MIDGVAARGTRLFHVYKGSLLVLKLEDRPGTLHSTAAPGPDGPPSHPFVHAIAVDALSENELGELLRRSAGFDDYLARLLGAGYDVASGEGGGEERPGGSRIVGADGAAGVIWPQPGQFTTLGSQPASGLLIFDAATLTVYRPESAQALLSILQSAADYESLCRAIEAEGFRLEPIG